MASNCIGEAVDWILAKISSWKGLSNIGTGCPEQWWSLSLEVFKRHVYVAFGDMIICCWTCQCWVNVWT